VPKMTFYEAVRKDKEERDQYIREARRKANCMLARKMTKRINDYNENISNAARGIGWSRQQLYRIFDIAEEDQREETSDE